MWSYKKRPGGPGVRKNIIGLKFKYSAVPSGRHPLPSPRIPSATVNQRTEYRIVDQVTSTRQFATDEHLDYVAALLDDMFRIPGTQIRFGLDAVIGWVPGIGDATTSIASFLIVFASWRRGAKSVTLARMTANVLLETAIGSIPVVGDAFHIVWKANRRNYRLLLREREQPGVQVGRDWMFLGVLLLAVILAVAIPVAILIWLLQLPITWPMR